MPMTLYCIDGSPPVRAVYLCLEALGLKAERKVVNILTKEQMKPEYLKMNPQHSVPTLDDDGFILWDSHAINAYLVSKYGKDDSLYPKEIKQRALVDQRLHFDTGILFPRLRDITFSLLFLKTKQITDYQRQRVMDAYDIMEKFLEGQNFIAGDELTIADFCCVATVSTLAEALRMPLDKHPLINAWLQRCKTAMVGYSACQDKGVTAIKGLVDAELG